MNIKKIVSIIVAVIWMSIVFSFSNQQGEGSSSTSKSVSEFIINIIDIKHTYTDSEKEKVIQTLEPYVRKLAHFAIYAIGGIAIINCVIQFTQSEKTTIVTSSLMGIIYAISDELHQLLVSGRSGKVQDVIIDLLGISTGIMLYLLIREFYKKIVSSKKMGVK